MKTYKIIVFSISCSLAMAASACNTIPDCPTGSSPLHAEFLRDADGKAVAHMGNSAGKLDFVVSADVSANLKQRTITQCFPTALVAKVASNPQEWKIVVDVNGRAKYEPR